MATPLPTNQEESTGPVQGPAAPSSLSVSTAGPALRSLSQAKTTLQTMQQGAQQQAQSKTQQQQQAQQAQQAQAAATAKTSATQKLAAAVNPATAVLQNQNTALAQKANAPGAQPPQVPPPPQGQTQPPLTQSPSANSLIGGIKGVQPPAAPTNLTDAFGQPITAPPGFTQADMTKYQQDLVSLQNGQTQAMQTIQTAVSNIANGTYPLTTAQQSLLNATNQSFQIAQQYQQMANQGTIQAQISLGARLGQNKYNPSGLLSTLSNTYNQAALTMADISSKQAIAVGTLEQSFQKDDLDAIQTQADIIEKSFEEQSSTISNLLSATQKYQSDMNTYNLSLAKDVGDAKQQEFTDQMDNANFSLTQKKDAFDSYMQQANLTETQKRDAETAWKDSQDVALQQANLALKEDPLGLSGAGAPTTLQGLVQSGILSQLPNGATYLDITQFSDAASKKEAEQVARQVGAPMITSPAQKTVITNLTTGQNDLTYVLGQFKAIAPQNAGEKFSDVLTNWAKAAAGTPEGNAYAAYQALQSTTLPGIVKDVSGLNRVNGTELQAASNALPNLNGTDTWASGLAKINSIQGLLNQNMNGALGDNLKFTNLNDFVKNNPNPSGAQQYISNTQKQYPNLSPEDVLQYIYYQQSQPSE